MTSADTADPEQSLSAPQADPKDGIRGKGWLSRLFRKANGERDSTERRNGSPASDADDAANAAHERALIQNIRMVRDLTVVDVMVPRADIIAIECRTEFKDLLEVMAETAHSRLPVYRETLDDVIGIVHMKDVMGAIARDTAFDLEKMVREVAYVAPSMRVLELLLELRKRRQQMAVVVDEYGGIDGLLTIEDLVEGIVGEIEDEHDRSQPAALIDRPDGSILADARVDIEVFEARVGPVVEDDERDDIDTLGGLVFALAGRVPARGELLKHPSGLEFEILDADPRRIRRLRVLKAPPAITPDPPPEPPG